MVLKIFLKRTVLVVGLYLLWVQLFFIFQPTGKLGQLFGFTIAPPVAVVDNTLIWYPQVVARASWLDDSKHKFKSALGSVIETTVMKNLAKGYGWQGTELRDFSRSLASNQAAVQKLNLAIRFDHTQQSSAWGEIIDLQNRLNQGLMLGDLAVTFSEHPTASGRGYLGIISADAMPPWLLPAINLPLYTSSEILSSEEAFWIVELNAFYASDSNPAYEFSGLAIYKKGLSKIVSKQLELRPPFVLVW